MHGRIFRQVVLSLGHITGRGSSAKARAILWLRFAGAWSIRTTDQAIADADRIRHSPIFTGVAPKRPAAQLLRFVAIRWEDGRRACR